MISLDNESLFTNVPVSETIDIILRQLYPQDNVIYQGFSKSDFHNLLKLAVEDSYFSFNNELYRQIDGMSMGSPLGPLFANIFLSYYESECILVRVFSFGLFLRVVLVYMCKPSVCVCALFSRFGFC